MEVTSATACDHRLAVIREDKCDVCNRELPKGTLFPVYGCSLHGECSVGRKKRGLTNCNVCFDRESKEFGILPVPQELRSPATKPAKISKPVSTPRAKADPATCTHRPMVHSSFSGGSVTIRVVCQRCAAAMLIDGQESATHSVTASSGSASS